MTIARRTGWYLISSICVPLLSLLTLPLYTIRLGPEQYGIFALGSSLATAVSTTAGSISALSLPVELSRCKGEDRSCYIGSVLLLGLIGALLTSLAMFGAYLVASTALGLGSVGNKGILLLFAGALLSSLWAIAVEIISIEGRAKRYTILTIVQILTSIVAVCISLFVFNDIENALFWGLFGSSFAGAIGAMNLLSGRLAFGSQRRWLPVAARGSLAGVLASLTESGKTAFERSYLGIIVGVNQLGLLAHGQYYKNASMVLINTVSRSLVPTSLREAESSCPDFSVTLRFWAPIQAMVAGITISLALIGGEIIRLLTNGKFVNATPVAVAFMLILLLQTAGKTCHPLLLVRGKGYIYANLNTFSAILALIFLVITTPYLGIWGVILATAFQTLFLRIALYWVTSTVYSLKFSDYWVIIGFVATGLCILLEKQCNLTFVTRSGVLIIIYLIILCNFWAEIKILKKKLRHHINSKGKA